MLAVCADLRGRGRTRTRPAVQCEVEAPAAVRLLHDYRRHVLARTTRPRRSHFADGPHAAIARVRRIFGGHCPVQGAQAWVEHAVQETVSGGLPARPKCTHRALAPAADRYSPIPPEQPIFRQLLGRPRPSVLTPKPTPCACAPSP